jgi:hypothetical protein
VLAVRDFGSPLVPPAFVDMVVLLGLPVPGFPVLPLSLPPRPEASLLPMAMPAPAPAARAGMSPPLSGLRRGVGVEELVHELGEHLVRRLQHNLAHTQESEGDAHDQQ